MAEDFFWRGTEAEVKRLIAGAGENRHAHRDQTMVLIAYRQCLRASEVCALRWDQVSLDTATLHVVRRKNGTPATHPLTGKELRALRRLRPSISHPRRLCLCPSVARR